MFPKLTSKRVEGLGSIVPSFCVLSNFFVRLSKFVSCFFFHILASLLVASWLGDSRDLVGLHPLLAPSCLSYRGLSDILTTANLLGPADSISAESQFWTVGSGPLCHSFSHITTSRDSCGSLVSADGLLCSHFESFRQRLGLSTLILPSPARPICC